jgi:hypothetical protein
MMRNYMQLESKDPLETKDIDGLLSAKLSNLRKDDAQVIQDSKHTLVSFFELSVEDEFYLLKLSQASIEAAMKSLTKFFQAHEEAERRAWEHQQHSNHHPFLVSSTTNAAESEQVVRFDPQIAAQECNFSLMSKLPGHWNQWTGNVPPAEDLVPFLPSHNNRHAYPGEVIKIPFKPSVWQRGMKRNHSGSFGRDSPEIRSGSPEVTGTTEPADRAESPTAGAGTGVTRPPFSQLQYGALRLAEETPGPYWSSLSMTESVMAHPCYQHLSSEKFRALEHFATLRSFADKEMIVQYQQRFFTIYYVR